MSPRPDKIPDKSGQAGFKAAEALGLVLPRLLYTYRPAGGCAVHWLIELGSPTHVHPLERRHQGHQHSIDISLLLSEREQLTDGDPAPTGKLIDFQYLAT